MKRQSLPQEDWASKRLLVVRLISQHEHTGAGGVKALIQRDWAWARRPTVRGHVADECLEQVEQGKFRHTRDA